MFTTMNSALLLSLSALFVVLSVAQCPFDSTWSEGRAVRVLDGLDEKKLSFGEPECRVYERYLFVTFAAMGSLQHWNVFWDGPSSSSSQAPNRIGVFLTCSPPECPIGCSRRSLFVDALLT